MEQQQYLIDSNAVIDYLGKKLSDNGMVFMNNVLDDKPKVSIITKIEVLGFNTLDAYYQFLVNFMNDVFIIDLTAKTVEKCIEIRKKHKIKLPDAIIAATAIAFDLTLISRNQADFKNIPELKVINPHNL